MTPQEIFEYKQKWMQAENNPVRIHSDLRLSAKDFCRSNFEKQRWSQKEYTAVYEDTFFFESSNDADIFRIRFKNWLTFV